MNKPNIFIEIHKNSFVNNIKQLKKIIGQSSIAIVVKSNAYGHGLKEISLIANSIEEIDFICTGTVDEAIELRKLGITKRILVLFYTFGDIETAIKQNIYFTIYNIENALEINKVAKKINRKAYIHIKIDTGMSRLGILADKFSKFLTLTKSFNNLVIDGMYTHLCDGYNTESNFAYEQLARFDNCLETLNQSNLKVKNLHALSSSGLLINWHTNYAMIRLGALIYGIWRSQDYKSKLLSKHPNLNLEPVMKLKSQIIDIKQIPEGSYVGYNRTFITTKPTKLGILPIGYADGYNLNLSNKSFVLIKNQLAPVIGIISMNLTTVDLTELNDVNIYDEVTLLGNHPEITSQQLALKSATIPNDFVTRIYHNIPRTIISNDNNLEMALNNNVNKFNSLLHLEKGSQLMEN